MQMMRRFVGTHSSCKYMKNLQVIEIIRLIFLLTKFAKVSKVEEELVTSFDMVRVSSRTFQFDNVDIWLNHSNLELPGKKFEYFLTERKHECVSQMYTFVLGQNIIVPNSCWKTYSLKKAGKTYAYLQSRNFRSANILAYWVGNDGNIQDLNKLNLTPRPG